MEAEALHDEFPVERPLPAMETMMVSIDIVEARDLKKSEISGKSDPYVAFVWAGEQYKTQVMQNTQKPEWHELFEIEFEPKSDPEVLTLRLYDHDPNSRHDCLGQVDVPFINITSEKREMWLPVVGQGSTGEIKILISGEPKAQQQVMAPARNMNVIVVEAKDLRDGDAGQPDKADAYVCLMWGGEMFKTSVKANSSAPYWDEQFQLQYFPAQDPAEFIFRIYDYDEAERDECLGAVRVPIDNQAVDQWYPIEGPNAFGMLRLRYEYPGVSEISPEPVFQPTETEEEFVLPIATNDQPTLELRVFDEDLGSSKDDFIGGVVIDLTEELIEPVENWYNLMGGTHPRGQLGIRLHKTEKIAQSEDEMLERGIEGPKDAASEDEPYATLKENIADDQDESVAAPENDEGSQPPLDAKVIYEGDNARYYVQTQNPSGEEEASQKAYEVAPQEDYQVYAPQATPGVDDSQFVTYVPVQDQVQHSSQYPPQGHEYQQSTVSRGSYQQAAPQYAPQQQYQTYQQPNTYPQQQHMIQQQQPQIHMQQQGMPQYHERGMPAGGYIQKPYGSQYGKAASQAGSTRSKQEQFKVLSRQASHQPGQCATTPCPTCSRPWQGKQVNRQQSNSQHGVVTRNIQGPHVGLTLSHQASQSHSRPHASYGMRNLQPTPSKIRSGAEYGTRKSSRTTPREPYGLSGSQAPEMKERNMGSQSSMSRSSHAGQPATMPMTASYNFDPVPPSQNKGKWWNPFRSCGGCGKCGCGKCGRCGGC
eukprot:Selendium_serpulae@DN5481_c0_g1_i5.p1